MPSSIILRHGPYSFYADSMAPLPEGQPYEAGIVDGNGIAIEILYLGGHDKADKLLGGGFQSYVGNVNNVTAPLGTAVIDTNNQIQVSNGVSWFTLAQAGQNGSSSGVPNPLDFGSYW